MCDWEAVQAEYIGSEISLRDLGKKHGIPRSTMERRCTSGGWVAKRKAYKQKAVEQAVADCVDVEAERLGKIIVSAQKMADVLEGVFNDNKQFYRHIVTDTFISDGGDKEILTVEKEFEKADSRAIKDLTGALKDMTLVLRNLYNLPTQAEREAQRIAAARLAIEQRKADTEAGGEDSVEVVLGELEDYAK